MYEREKVGAGDGNTVIGCQWCGAKDQRIAQLEAQLAEALARWGETDHELTEVQVENARLRAGYAEAIEDIADWACYAEEYFQRKHDLAGTLAKHQAVLAGQRGESHD